MVGGGGASLDGQSRYFSISGIIQWMTMAFQGDINDAALIMYSVLRRLGSGEVDTFAKRLHSQKAQYIAQIFAISPVYNFNLYIRGPYSPDLARDLFELKRQRITPKIEKFTPSELEERFQKAKGFMAGKTVRQLELVVTLHWLIDVARLSPDVARTKLKAIKTVDDEQSEVIYESVQQLCQLSRK